MNLEPYQQRVVEEKQELDAKIEALKNFNKNPKGIIRPAAIFLLAQQEEIMQQYSEILQKRIDLFE